MEYYYNIYDYDYILTHFRKTQKTFFIISPVPFIYNLKKTKKKKEEENKVKEKVS